VRAAAGLLAEPRDADDPDVLDLGRTRLVTAWAWHLITSIRSRPRSLPGHGHQPQRSPDEVTTHRRTARRKTRHGLKPAACIAITDSHGELAQSRRSASIMMLGRWQLGRAGMIDLCMGAPEAERLAG
jgi:hypothetical protein